MHISTAFGAVMRSMTGCQADAPFSSRLKTGTALALLAFAVFLAAVRLEQPRSTLLARIGLISYAMYLFHGPVNAAVYRALPLTGERGDLVTMLVCISLTLALSSFIYHAVERPMIRLGRSLSARREAPSAYSIALKRLR